MDFIGAAGPSGAAVLGLFLPPLLGGLPCDLGAPFAGHGVGACFAALPPQRSGSRVFALFFWRRRAVLDLASGDVDHQLGGLAKVSRALAGRVLPVHFC
jgi:hypothetical protein